MEPFNAQVILQGDKALTLLAHTPQWAKYHVIGFDYPTITLLDYRRSGLLALHNLLETGAKARFTPEFNAKFNAKFNVDAAVSIDEGKNDVLITLTEPTTQPRYVLWIAVGVNNYLPVYDHTFRQLACLGINRFALVSLHRIASAREYQPERLVPVGI